ncbi:MAG: dethiobiotin synthase [Actinomycetota bacterium]
MITFVTGTDTGVGKTIASAWLVAAARAAGRSVRYAKPVQTGLAPGEHGSDADFVRAATGAECEELLRLTEPLAPAVAAERADTTIDADRLVSALQERAKDCDELVVEGAGGLLVPLDEGWTMADLAGALGAQVVVVTRPGLGTLNHTALTLEAAGRRGLLVAGLVVCGWPVKPGITEQTNLERLAAMAPILHTIPFLPGVSVERSEPGPLRDLLAQV